MLTNNGHLHNSTASHTFSSFIPIYYVCSDIYYKGDVYICRYVSQKYMLLMLYWTCRISYLNTYVHICLRLMIKQVLINLNITHFARLSTENNSKWYSNDHLFLASLNKFTLEWCCLIHYGIICHAWRLTRGTMIYEWVTAICEWSDVLVDKSYLEILRVSTLGPHSEPKAGPEHPGTPYTGPCTSLLHLGAL